MAKVLITGASSGLGYSLAEFFLEKGDSVINVSRSPCDLDVRNISADLSEPIDVLLEQLAGLSDIKTLVLNAGVLHWDSIGSISRTQIVQDFNVNIVNLIQIANVLIPIVNANDGDVVIIGSTSAYKSSSKDSVYVSTKHAVRGFIQALQTEYKNEKVRIIGVHPGGFDSNLHKLADSGLDSNKLMKSMDLAQHIMSILALPRSVEISEVIINRKKANF